MKFSIKNTRRSHRRGAVAILAAFLMVVLFMMVAYAIDLGYVTMVRTQLQTAADAAALAAAGASGLNANGMTSVAQAFASYHQIAGRPAELNATDVQLGSWDASARAFVPGTSIGTAVKVTVRTSTDSGGKTALFFGKLFGLSTIAQEASAVATVNPRDIAFVVDLSGSMSDDTNPTSGSATTSLMQNVYSDFGFGTYPGTSQSKSWGKSTTWLMNNQLKSVMPNAIPTPNTSSSASVNYWGSYFSFLDNYGRQMGYKSYVEFMMRNGRDGKPDGSNYTPLSIYSSLCACPMHSETVGDGVFQFPPREMPMHACRRALIAALQIIRDRNAAVDDTNQRDWVSIITFDKINSGSPAILQALTSDYNNVMTSCTKLEACSNSGLCTNTESGLNLARNHIKPISEGGAGRERTNKIVVLLTDGQPNLKQSSSTTISAYKSANPSTWTNPATGTTVNNWSATGSYTTEQQAALMQTSMMQGDGWNVYAVGVGLDCSVDFMDRLARMGATANPTTGKAPDSAGDSTTAEENLKKIFNAIITNPKLRLVQ
ncbi:MAG: VWA domain-containing protein [Planctomycetaceae bacterium]|nr:VWA domain-containing protein [Planctomycetaceae bacterium]